MILISISLINTKKFLLAPYPPLSFCLVGGRVRPLANAASIRGISFWLNLSSEFIGHILMTFLQTLNQFRFRFTFFTQKLTIV